MSSGRWLPAYTRAYGLSANDSFSNGVKNQIREIAQVQLLLQISTVRLDRISAQIPQRGDLFVGFPLGEQVENLPLARCQ